MIIYQQKEPEASIMSKLGLLGLVLLVLVGVFFVFYNVFAVTTDKLSYVLGEDGTIDNCAVENYFNIFNLTTNGINITGASGCDILPDTISNQFNEDDWANFQAR